ncbi:MAG: type II secretion system protein GspL [Betaproteobacteria bacterium]
MTTLRVRLPAPFDPSAPAAWWRVDDSGRILDRGVAPASSWPPAERTEVVMAPADVRIVALALPPMPVSRLRAAALFALEDQLAAPASSMHVSLTAQPLRDIPTLVRIVDRAVIAFLTARRPAIDRVIAEPDLVARDGAWHWCAGVEGESFVRRPDGSAFATEPSGLGSLPPELGAALARAPREAMQSRDALRVVVDAEVNSAHLAAWSQATGATFVCGTPWSLDRVPADAWRAAPDLREGFAEIGTGERQPLARALAPALGLVAAAALLHALATAGAWAHDRYVALRADAEVVALARNAGLEPVPDARVAEALLTRRGGVALHASARMADGDALPMLARASNALAALPPGMLRKLSLSERRIVAELGRLDAARLGRLVQDLGAAGLVAVSAPVTGGVRVSATAEP